MKTTYLTVTQEAGRDFVRRGIEGPVVMLNLLRFRTVADYSGSPELAPAQAISGKEAYQLYMEHTLPHLQSVGGEIVFMGQAGPFLIGPQDMHWDEVLLVRHRSVEDFLRFASDPEFRKGGGHREAALEDSRLLPMVEGVTVGSVTEG